MTHKIPQSIPYIGKEELANLTKVIKNKWLTEGPFTKEFTERLKDFTGAKYVILTNNGTLALYLSLIALDVGPRDGVILPDFTFCASASSIALTGATPMFVDINKTTLLMDYSKAFAAITFRNRFFMPVHLYGRAVNVNRFQGGKIIEDAAQGLGVYFFKRHVGTLGNIGIISFYADKTITTGEGAAILTNDESLYSKILFLRNQGRKSSGGFIHPSLGLNFRFTDLQAAVGLAQLKKFNEIKERKLENYNSYVKYISSYVSFLITPPYSNFVPFRANILSPKRAKIEKALIKAGVQTRRLFLPLHRQPCFQYLNYPINAFPNSNLVYERGLSLPVYPTLSKKNIKYICKVIKRAL